MKWKLKAFIQNSIAILPKPISYELYYQTQRHFGELKKPFNPIEKLNEIAQIFRKIQKQGYDIKGKSFLEVGTGRVPLFPIASWLCGAEKFITMDLNPYMRDELIKESLSFVKTEEEKIKTMFGDLINSKRFDLLLSYSQKKISKEDILKLCQTEYLAPGDARKTNLQEKSIHYHVSNAVYEHIPLDVVFDILEEGNRIIADDGLFINAIDYSDHFFYSDNTISAINFLQYSDRTWSKYAGNRYMYMNRARHDDFVEWFQNMGHDFLDIELQKNSEILELLDNEDFILDDKFRSKSKEILSITNAFFITKKKKT